MKWLLVIASPLLFAKSPSKTVDGIHLESHIGDRHAFFSVIKEKGRPVMKFHNNAGIVKTVPLTEDDVRALDSKIKALPKKNNDLALCPTAYVEVTSKYGNRSACADGKTPLTKKMAAITRALASLL
jgi:hypothetical protein